jgi:hypothetical protein
MSTRNVTLAISREAHRKARLWPLTTMSLSPQSSPRSLKEYPTIRMRHVPPSAFIRSGQIRTPLPPVKLRSPPLQPLKPSKIIQSPAEIPQLHRSCEAVEC